MNWNPSLLESINEYRIESGLVPLQVHPELCNAANHRLEEIQSDFSHRGFGMDLCSVCNMLGENLARGFEDKARVVPAWINSSSHKEIIVKREYTHGCTVYNDGYAVFEAGVVNTTALDRGYFVTPIIIAMFFLKVVRFL